MNNTITAKRDSKFKKIIEQKYLFLMLLPGFILVAIFSYTPLLGWIMAFTDYHLGDNLFRGQWVGFAHFKEFFADSGDAIYVIRNTLVINTLTIGINLGMSCILAIMINEVRNNKFKKIVQSTSLFPFFISWPIIFIVFYTFLSYNGVLNNTLTNLGILKDGIDFFGNEALSWPLIILVNMWRYIGYYIVIYFATLSGIPPEQYESAEVDGANRFHKIVYITIPSLIPTMIVLLLLNLGWVFSSNFEQYFLFTNTINQQTMEVFDVYIYRYGLKLSDYSYATAVGIIKAFASVIVLTGANLISKKSTGQSIF